MINLYYTPATGSFTSSLTILSDSAVTGERFYSNVTVETTASAYDTSGSSFDSTVGELRVYVKSGSSILASFPTENTTIYYNQSPYGVLIPSPPISVETSSFVTNWYFTPDVFTTSSNNIFAIYSSSLSTSSIYQTQSINNGALTLTKNTNYTVLVSGSGLFYTSSILIINQSTSTTSSYVSSSNIPLTASFSASNITDVYNIYAITEAQPYLALTYTAPNFPVANTSSLNQWNTLLGITASAVSSSGNTIYIYGGDLGTINTLSHTGSKYLNSFTSSYLPNITTLNLVDELLTTFPNLSNLPNIVNLNLSINSGLGGIISYITSSQYLQTFTFNNTNLSGSVSDLLSKIPTGSIQIIDIHNNSVTGSVPILSSSFALQAFSASNNSLNGSIKGFDKNYNLRYFDVSYNALTGSIPSLNDCVSLTYFDVTGNQLNSLPPLPTSSFYLTTFSCRSNKISGSIPNFSSSFIQYFDCSYNNFTGSIDISGSSNLITFHCGNNQLSGSINSLEGCTNLTYFNYSNNHITGSIPRLTNTPSLQTFVCTNNGSSQNYPYSTDILPPSLLNFAASNAGINNSSSIDNILYGLDAAGSISGSVNLSGTSNSAPSLTGLNYVSSLTNKGWAVSTNDPFHYITMGTASSWAFNPSFTYPSTLNYGQTFSMFESGSLQKISIPLSKDGSPDFTIQCNLYDQSGIGLPYNILATSTNAVSASSLLSSPSSGSLVEFTFNNYILTGSLSSTGSYAFGLVYSNVVTHDSSNWINVVGSNNDYLYGSLVYANTSTPNIWIKDTAQDVKAIISYYPLP